MSSVFSVVRRAAVAAGIGALVVGLGSSTTQAGNQPTLSVSVSCDSQTGQQAIHWSYTNVSVVAVQPQVSLDAFSAVQLDSGSIISVDLVMLPSSIEPDAIATGTSYATFDAVGTVRVVMSYFDGGEGLRNAIGTATLTGCPAPTTTTAAPTTSGAPASQAPLPETGGDNSLLPVAAALLGTGVVLLAARRRLNA
ncbi:MAG: LPXTG cell wall anchor domain-containing protein [Actinobacteria bacterium]|nr:LPXTG cell wall anchor domain-containing protein [Actinomycetota bacterium]